MSAITSREVETDGDLVIEILVDGVVRLELVWSGIPSRGEHPGWTPVTPGTREPVGEPWPWDADEQRELANLEDALHDHRTGRAPRSELRVAYWERQARDTSAVAAAAWARDRLTGRAPDRAGPPDG